METYKVDTVLKQSGTLTLKQLPFKVGEHVKVIVIPAPRLARETAAAAYPLHGTVLRYDDPLCPSCRI